MQESKLSFLLIFMSILLFSCDSMDETKKVYDEKVIHELQSSEETNETIFKILLGNDKNEVEDRLERLAKEGEIKYDEDGFYYINDYLVEGTKNKIKTEFYKNQLLHIELEIKKNDYNSNPRIYSDIYDHVIEKISKIYGKPDLDDPTNKLDYASDWVKGRVFWIDNNREIILSRTSLAEFINTITIKFVDKRLEKMREQDPSYQKEKEEKYDQLMQQYDKNKSVEIKNSEWDGSVSQVEDYLNDNLKNPDSFKPIEWSKVQKLPNGNFQVRCKYKAENSFGGTVVENQIFIISPKGVIINITDY